MSTPKDVIALCVGNTRTRGGVFHNDELTASQTWESTDVAGIVAGVQELATSLEQSSVVMATVNRSASDAIAIALEVAMGNGAILRIGQDVPIPLKHTLDDDSTLGQDRALNAIAAYEHAKQACIVVDVGTAVTVDFVDGEGVFHGGVIFPGLNMMLRALHQQTAALPVVRFADADKEQGILGKDTKHAMTLGVLSAVRGGIRAQSEATALFYGAYPQIVATGGDMGILEEEGLIEHFVADLQLLGVHACVRASCEEAGV